MSALLELSWIVLLLVAFQEDPRVSRTSRRCRAGLVTEQKVTSPPSEYKRETVEATAGPQVPALTLYMSVSRLRQLLHQLVPRSTSTLSRPPTTRALSTMSNVPEGVTAACCAPPAIVRSRDEYELKGAYKPYSVFDKTYITGPEDTDKAIIFV